VKKPSVKCWSQFLVFSLCSYSAFADTNIAFGPKVSTLGIGPEAEIEVVPNFNFRLGLNTFKYSRNFRSNDINWNGKLKFFTVAGLFDYHPFGNNFFISAGPMYNGNKLNVSALPTQNTTINGTTYTVQELGSLDGQLKFHKVSPYVGFGYNSAFSNTDRLSFTAELGVLYQGNAHATVTATGTYTNNSRLLADVKSEAEKAANKNWIRFYPVISLGLKYRF